MNCQPKPRNFRRYMGKTKSRVTKSGRVIRKGKDMRELRQQAFQRSEGYCEDQCGKRIFWGTFELHHERHRSLGGSDVLENVMALTRECHRKAHSL